MFIFRARSLLDGLLQAMLTLCLEGYVFLFLPVPTTHNVDILTMRLHVRRSVHAVWRARTAGVPAPSPSHPRGKQRHLSP